jgi:hypothetical protein
VQTLESQWAEVYEKRTTAITELRFAQEHMAALREKVGA